MATEKSFTFLTNASWTPDLQSGWSISNWTPIYNINYFLHMRAHAREGRGSPKLPTTTMARRARFWRALAILREGQDLRRHPGTHLNRSTPRTWWHSTNCATAANTSWSACSKTWTSPATLSTSSGVDQLRPHQPVHRPGLQGPRLPVQRHRKIPFGRPVDGQQAWKDKQASRNSCANAPRA